tara:strand:+ start:24375 stop:25520 length:1146 start_codon:yes stop_codon:yes gene_type:complete
MAKDLSLEWDVNNTSPALWCEGQAPCFKLWKTTGEMTALLDADMLPYIVGFTSKVDEWIAVVRRASELKRASGKKLKPFSRKWFKWLYRQPECQDPINHCDSLINGWTVGAQADSCIPYITVGTGNFRYDIAFSREYKGTRKADKPPFFELLKWHLIVNHNAVQSLTEEADDLMAIEQYSRNELLVADGAQQGSKEAKLFSNTIIVTKDKDLRMIAGWHSNPDINKGEPFWVDYLGYLEPVYYPDDHQNEKLCGKMKKLGGGGMRFFYAQLLMGDSVDNYQGIPLMGQQKTYDALKDCTSVKQLHKRVVLLYRRKYREHKFMFESWTKKKLKVGWKDMLVQQGRLAWMQTCPKELWMSEHVLPITKNWKLKTDNRGQDGKV